MKYTFGKGKSALLVIGKTLCLYSLNETQKNGTNVEYENISNTTDLEFNSIESVDNMIVQLKTIRKNLVRKKLDRVLKELL